MKELLLYIWQLPQNLVGLLLRAIYKGYDSNYEDAIVRRSTTMSGGISLGKYIILSNKREKSIRHEWGHCIQSKILGWLYLPIVGLWSGLHCAFCKCIKHSYYDIWCEKWADKLGGVQR